MTTREPGASEVLTHGLVESPLAFALRASSPAATSTAGFEVLVQLVIAAMSTAPSLISTGAAPSLAAAVPVAVGFFWERSSAIFFTLVR